MPCYGKSPVRMPARNIADRNVIITFRLAATMGSKMKKLPRRDVISADIAQLCNLIATPPEPLALRLSSNLMVGVVR